MRGMGGFGMFGLFGGGPSPPPLETLPDPEGIVVDQNYINLKEWERKYNKWLMSDGEKPGPHPDPEHKWNKEPGQFIF